ncbi:MAG: hypothetical protein RIB98_06860 [Acidimicrobiales bacterium]
MAGTPPPTVAPQTVAPQTHAIPRPSERRIVRPTRRLAWTAPAGWALCGIALLAYALAPAVGRSSILGTAVAALAVLVSWPVFSRLGSKFPEVEIAGLLRVSLGLKLLATLPRFEGREDSVDYFRAGAELANSFRRLDFTVDTGRSIPGTGSVRYLTGLVEVLTLEDEFATFVVFSLFGFIGLVLFLLACRAALPAVDPVRYALLLMLWPSLVYWPSSIGKESVVLLGLGMVALGGARLLEGGLRGLALAAPGLLVVGLVRPHVALIAVTAMVVAVITRAPGRGAAGVVARVGIVAALVIGGSVAADSVEALSDTDGLNPTGLSAALDLVNARSSQGGSHFEAARIDGLSEYPWGFVTVIFRPFPHEASSAPMLLTSLEGMLLAGLLITAIPRVMAAVRSIRDEAYVAYALSFTIVFVYLFSAMGNFGIIARQRVMTLPLILVIVALPTAKDRIRQRRVAAHESEARS